MKNFFLALLALLIMFSQYIQYRASGAIGSQGPVVYWVADGSTYRRGQYQRFLEWMKETHQPPMDFRIDPANNSLQKVILQGVTGTAGDIIQCFATQIRYLDEIGILEDLTPWIKDLGVSTNDLFAGYQWMINEGRVVAFPANSGTSGPYCVNANAFTKLGLPFPPDRWSFEEFERLGKQYVEKANADKPRLRRFFAMAVNTTVMRNSVGVPMFNETMTAPAFNDPRYAAILKLQRKWIYEDRILPSQADMDSFTQEGDNYGGTSALLHRGFFAMMNIGRWHFCTTRFMSTDVNYRCVAHPDGGFLNSVAGGKFNAVYKGSKRKAQAKIFMKWLASDDYNLKIIADADGEPPNMAFLKTEAYLKPAKYPNEWDFNRDLSRLILTTAVPEETTPFAIPGIYGPRVGKVSQGFMSGLITAEEMLLQQETIIRDAINEHLGRRPEVKVRYLEAVKRQQEIDAMKASGKSLPLALVDNPFLRVYYQKTGKAK